LDSGKGWNEATCNALQTEEREEVLRVVEYLPYRKDDGTFQKSRLKTILYEFV